MHTEKEKVSVNIVCHDGSLLKGNVYINVGERVFDFINDTREQFIIVSNAIFKSTESMGAFKLYNDIIKKQGTVVLNKTSIKWLEVD